jgi:hypothetical protein
MRIRYIVTIIAGAWLAAFCTAVAAAPLAIQNENLQVSFDPASGTFTIARVGLPAPLLTAGRLLAGGGQASVGTAVDKTLGQGPAIVVTHDDGSRDLIVLPPKQPFALFRSTLANRGTSAKVLNRLGLVSFNADLRAAGVKTSPSRWKTLGTGGLLPADKNPGSFAWLALADPASRSGVVCGWISNDRGSGIVFSKLDGGLPHIGARVDYGRLRIMPGKTADTETFAVGWFDDARLGLEAWADVIAKTYAVKLPPPPCGYCTYYSEKFGGGCDEKHLVDLAEFAAKHLKQFGFQFVQIDDGWQAGAPVKGSPRKNFTTHDPKGPYPHGMKATADNMKRLGLMPGLWFMPFAGEAGDPWFAKHQDWFVKREDGQPYQIYWTGTALDLTRADVRDYVASVARRIARDWGYTFFKMDGFHAATATKQTYPNMGYTEDNFGDSVLADPDKTNIEAYRDGIKLVRQAAGKDVFLLGCCIPQNMRSYSGAFGLLDAMRIGPDNGAGWKSWLETTAPTGTRSYFLNGRVWWNDPDCMYARKGLTLDQARTICSWTAIAGQLTQDGDWMPNLPPERLEILKRTMPAHCRLARPVDLFENDPARVWLVTDTGDCPGFRSAAGESGTVPLGWKATGPRPRRDVLAIFNFGKGKQEFDLPLDRLGLPPAKAYVAFDFWGNALCPPLTGHLKLLLPEAGCRLLAVRPAASHPQLLSTSRHVTQGMIDVRREHWSAKRNELSGRSLVVGGDPYELRIVYTAGHAAQVAAVDVSADDKAAGVGISTSERDRGVRVTIRSAQSREVAWRVRFKVTR